MGESIEKLTRLLQSLSSFELDILKKYLTEFDASYGQRHTKTLQLLEILNSYPSSDRKDKLEVFKEEMSHDAFKMLVSRLRSKTVDSLLWDINVNRPNSNSELLKSEVSVKKLIAQVKILLQRGNSEEGIRLLDKAIQRAKKFELVNDMNELLYLKLQNDDLEIDSEKYEEVKEELAFYDKARQALLKVNEWEKTLAVNSDNTSIEYLLKLKKAIDDLRYRYKICKISKLGYTLYHLQYELGSLSNDYSLTKRNCNKLLKLLEGNSQLYSPKEEGIVYVNLAKNELKFGNFKNCIRFASKAESYLIDYPNDFLLSQELLFKSYFQLEKWETCFRIINQILMADFEGLDLSKWKYYKATVLFKLKKYQDAKLLVKNVMEIKNDRIISDVIFDIFKVMLDVECATISLKSNDINVYRAKLQKAFHIGNEVFRYKLILKLLESLVVCDFNIAAFSVGKEIELSVLSQDLKNRYLSDELISFEQWVDQQVMANIAKSLNVEKNLGDKKRQEEKLN